jgi:ABC-type transport system involved in multi-copper enzyme maturation permease subunit
MVQRELRVLARKPATYRLRLIIGGLAFGLALLLIMAMGLAGTPRGWGSALFSTLTVYATTVCFMVGLFGTADIISEERREGTLGLLFLTDLKGYDVVLGKFSAVALNAFYWLLAIIPVLSLPLLIGGVTFGEFVRVAFALMNLLFVAMAIGTWASAGQTEVIRSLGASVLMLLVTCAISPALFAAINWSQGQEHWALVTFSPLLPLFGVNSTKYGALPQLYWYPLLASQLLGWALLALTAWRLPVVWQKPAKETGGWTSSKSAVSRREGTFAERAKWLDSNPAMFLMRPERGIRTFTITLVTMGCGLFVLDLLFVDGQSLYYAPFLSGLLKWLTLLPFKILLAVHACRFFSTARQSGVFELLLSTPLTTKEIVSAHWTVIHRTFLWPFVVLCFFVIFGGIKVLFLRSSQSMGVGVFEVLFLSSGIVSHVFDYFLIGWMGAWMGLKLKRPGWAPFFTILFALVLPSFLCGLGFMIKPVLIAVARHNVVYELPRLVRKQFDGTVDIQATAQTNVPPPLR